MLKQWLVSLVFACIAGAAVSAVSPKGNSEKTLKTIVGIFIIAAICAPLSELKNKDFSVAAFSPAFEELNENDMDEYALKSLENEIESRVSEIIQKHRLNVGEIKIKAENIDGCIIIHDIIINMQKDGYKSAQYAARIISDELGIPVTLTE